MKLYLCQYGSTSAVIAAKGVGQARSAFMDKIDSSSYLLGFDRKQIVCRTLKNVSHPSATDDAEPFVLAQIG